MIVSSAGKAIRLGRIFRDDGRSFVITMDHGVDLGPVEGLEDIRKAIMAVLRGEYKPDAILMNPSMIRLCHDELVSKLGILARLDGTATIMGPDITNYRLFSTVEDALAAGADAVTTMLFIGVERESENSQKIGGVTRMCNRWGVPHFIEALPPEVLDYYFKPKAERRWPNPEHIRFADRVAAELGADVVKSLYTGDPHTFSKAVESCPVPIIVASGPKSGDPEEVLSIVRDVLDAGAKGVIMGRNVWGYKNPTSLVEAISRMIHEDISVEHAQRIIK